MRAPWITERPTAPQPITATRAPSQTFAVSRTDITPVATAQPSKHACSGGSSRGTFAAATAGTTVCVAKVPVRRTGVNSEPSARKSRPGAAGGRLHWRGSPRSHEAHVAAGGFPTDDDTVALGEPGHTVTQRLDHPGPLVAEEDRERVVPAVLLDHVQVAVADAGGLDPDEHLAGARGLDADFLERDAPGLG